MNNTKEKILAAALYLFNHYGLVNVRLQQIANEVGISVGNLAYHFYSKEAIVKAIDQELSNLILSFIGKDRRMFSLVDFDNHLAQYYHLLKEYSFYFLDVLELERAYPALHQKRKKHIQRMIQQIEIWIQEHVQKGTFQPAIQENQYQTTAHTIWMIVTFWMTQQQVSGMGSTNEGTFKEAVWNQLLPLLTPVGLMEFEAIILPQLKLGTLPDLS